MFNKNTKVFIGGRELLTSALTSGEVINWLIGPSGALSEYGYVPINENRNNR